MIDESTSPTQTPADTTAPATPDPWNGELDHLTKQEWYSKLPEDVRPHVEQGLKTKWTNLEGGYSKKFQSLADERKGWETEKSTLSQRLQAQEREALLYKDLFGGSDSEAVSKFESEKKELQDKLAALEGELSPLREYKTKAEQAATQAYEAQVKAEADRMASAYKDIIEHKEEKVFDFFSKLVTAGIEEDEAASLTRKKFDVSTPQPPKAAVIASRGDAPAGRDGLPDGLSPIDMITRAAANAARKMGA
jgi:hypothetical protein